MSLLLQICELFEVVWRRLRAIFRPSRPALDLAHTPIHRLPPEILLLITAYLPIESGVSLSLACYPFYSYLGKHCVGLLKAADYSTLIKFLHFLEHDFPYYIVCLQCNRLHSMYFARNHLPDHSNKDSPHWLACWSADLKNDGYSIYDEFSSTIFLMAMKAYRQDYKTPELLHLLTQGTRSYFSQGFVEQYTATARIQDGSLLVREQKIFMVPSSMKFPVPCFGSMRVCSHIRLVFIEDFFQFGIEIPYSNEINGYKNTQGIIYCQYCFTEFRVDFKSYGKAGNAMFITTWMDIGEGKDLNDHKFQSRIGRRYEIGDTYVNAHFPRGSICAAFEQKNEAEFEFDSLLTQQDKKILSMKSPYPWPRNTDVSCVGATQYFIIRNGRMIPARRGTLVNIGHELLSSAHRT
jgi:hypothetical protein